VARCADCLKIVVVIGPAFGFRNDVVDLRGWCGAAGDGAWLA